jgi:broad specificity phosphatase PhoE
MDVVLPKNDRKDRRDMRQVYLVRHAQTSLGNANYDELSAIGLRQARILGQWFTCCGQRFQVIVTGGMKRHLQTADACLSTLPKAAQQIDGGWKADAGFNEFNVHEIVFRYRPELADPEIFQRSIAETLHCNDAIRSIFGDAVTRWMTGKHDAEYSETWPMFRTRAVAALQRLISSTEPSQKVLVFTSGGTIAALCQHVLGLGNEPAFEMVWSQLNCAVTKLVCHSDGATLSYFNNFSHLEWSGAPDVLTFL